MMRAQRSVLFELNQHSFHYGSRRVLEEISLRITEGERVALVGKSGSGKSTLVKLFYQQQRQLAALCPQHLGLVPMLSVFHNVYMGRLQRYSTLHNLRTLIKPHTRDLKEIGELCEQLGLSEKLRVSVNQLSGGQMQRTALGRAIYQQNPIFIGDEPVSSVDEYQAKTLLDMINHTHPSVVVALHDVELALACFDRLIGLKAGRIVLDQPTSQLTPDDLTGLYR